MSTAGRTQGTGIGQKGQGKRMTQQKGGVIRRLAHAWADGWQQFVAVSSRLPNYMYGPTPWK